VMTATTRVATIVPQSFNAAAQLFDFDCSWLMEHKFSLSHTSQYRTTNLYMALGYRS